MLPTARTVVTLTIMWALSCDQAVAQEAVLLKALKTGANTWDFTPTASDGTVCFIDNTVGPTSVRVDSDSMVSAMGPDLLVRYEKIIYGSFVGPDRVWVNGAPKAGGSIESATIAESTDDGSTWHLFDLSRLDGRSEFPAEQRTQYCDYQYDGFTRYDDLFSSDGGAQWSYVPVPDSVGKPDPVDYCYLGNGKWSFYSESMDRWYELDLEQKRWVISDIPPDVNAIYGLPSGIRFGYKGKTPKQSFVYWNPTERIYRDTVIKVDGRFVADSVWISRFTQVRGGGVVALVEEGLTGNTMITWGDNDLRVLFPDSVQKRYTLWSILNTNGQVAISDDNVVYTMLAAGGKPPVPENLQLYVDVNSGTWRRIESLPFRFKPIVMHQGQSFENVPGKYILRRGYDEDRVVVLGEIDDKYGRAKAIEFNCVASTTTGLIVIRDQWGDVVSLADDNMVELHAFALDGYDRVYDEDQRLIVHPLTSLSLGEENLWDPHGFVVDSTTLEIMSGGTKLIGIDTSGQYHTVVSDTTTAWHVGGSGMVYSAYRYIRTKTLDGQAGVLQIQGRGQAAISSIVELDQSNMVVGLRGYTIAGSAGQDTVKGGILYSDDGGLTWTESTSDNEALINALVTSITQRPADGSLWASLTWATVDAMDSAASPTIDQDGFALMKSVDGGRSWVTVQELSYRGPWRSSSSNVVCDQGNVVAWAALDRVHYSSDGGNAFKLVEGLHGLTIRVGSIDIDTSGRLLISTNEGLYAVPAVNVSVDEPVERSYPAFWASTYPNPTTGKLTVRVQNLKAAGGPVTRLEIVDIFGRSVFNIQPELAKHGMVSGQDVIEFEADLSHEPGGVYFLVGVTHNRNTLWKVLISR